MYISFTASKVFVINDVEVKDLSLLKMLCYDYCEMCKTVPARTLSENAAE